MTNQYVITPDMVDKKEIIKIIDKDEKIILSIKLDSKERIIQCFNKSLNIDITIIEIIPQDNLNYSFFLKANSEPFEQFIGKTIEIIHYPKDKGLSFSFGKIFEIYEQNMFSHDACTEQGSGGSPIILKETGEVIGIHKGCIPNKKINIGIFIKNVVDKMKNYKREEEKN